MKNLKKSEFNLDMDFYCPRSGPLASISESGDKKDTYRSASEYRLLAKYSLLDFVLASLNPQFSEFLRFGPKDESFPRLAPTLPKDKIINSYFYSG